MSLSAENPPLEPARSLRLSILDGLFASAHATITSGALVTGYALFLHASDFHIGALSAVGALATIGALLSAYWIGYVGGRKGLVVWGTALHRLLWGLLGLLPLLLGASRRWIWLFVVLVGVLAAIQHFTNNAWLSWMTDLVPLPSRGRYFGARSALLGLVGLAASFAGARTMDHLRAQGREATGFAIVFAVTAALALLSSLILHRQWEPPLQGASPLPFAALVRLPLAHTGSRRFLGFLLFWSIATGIAGPFFGAHMLKNLKMSYTGIAIYSGIATVGGVGSQLLWGRIIDRIGCHRVLLLNHIGVALLPLLWLFATPGFLLPIWIDAFLTGLFWPGFNLAQFNLTLEMAPQEHRSAYLAMQSIVGGVAAFAAALLAGVLAAALGGFTVAVGKQVLINFHLLFFMTAMLRLLLLPMSHALKVTRAGAPAPGFAGREEA